MSQRACHFLVAWLLMFSTKIFSQQQLPLIAQKDAHTLKFSDLQPVGIGQSAAKFQQQRQFGIYYFSKENCTILGRLGGLSSYYVIAVIPKNFYAAQLPFECTSEIKLEKLTTIPLRIRLGSLDYVNKLEGKQ